MKRKNNLLPVQKGGEYATKNLENWRLNREYWLNNPLRHVEDNSSEIDNIVDDLCLGKESVLDLGCGNGFLYERIRQKYPDIRYVGVDFNPDFVEYLKKTYGADDNADFLLLDITSKVDEEINYKFDSIFCFFVLFELDDINPVFESAVKLLSKNGIFSIFTIEYTYLILAVSSGMTDFKRNLVAFDRFRQQGKVPYIFQKIDLDTSESESLTYGSVFYSTSDFISAGLKVGFSLKKMDEYFRMNKFHPKTYQYFEFEK